MNCLDRRKGVLTTSSERESNFESAAEEDPLNFALPRVQQDWGI